MLSVERFGFMLLFHGFGGVAEPYVTHAAPMTCLFFLDLWGVEEACGSDTGTTHILSFNFAQ